MASSLLYSYLLLLSIICLFLPSSSSAASTIMLAGDSHAEMSEMILQDVCGGSKVVNVGVSGSQAYEFATGDMITGGCIDRPQRCTPDGVFTSEESDEVSTDFTHMYLSLGGNDWLDNGCTASIQDGVSDSVRGAINEMLRAGPSGMKILMTGYSYASDEFDDCTPGDLPLLMEAIENAVKSCDDPSRVEYIDVIGLFGGTPSKPFSNKKFYEDAI